jgi:hypothetical protein
MTWEMFQLDLLSFRYGNAIRSRSFSAFRVFFAHVSYCSKDPQVFSSRKYPVVHYLVLVC